jgi:phosphate starvation-inducible PhoH-like protein
VQARTLTFEDNDHLREVVGEFGAHLKLVAQKMGVEVTQRGSTVRFEATNGAVDSAAQVVEQLYVLVERGFPLHTTDVATAIRVLRADPNTDLADFFSDTIVIGAGNRPVTPRTPGQRTYIHSMRENAIVFGVGPAGTGKTYLAVAFAVATLSKAQVRRIVLTRPAVEAGEKLGFLPGDLTEKVDPYLRPLYDALADMLPPDRVSRLIDSRVIEIAPLAFMRGRTLNDAFIILDEAQNTSVEQMRMFLTRMGDRSRMAVTGDDTQIDLPRGQTSGLIHAIHLLKSIPEVDVVRLTSADIVRHPVVAKIVDAYARDDATRYRDRNGEPGR